MGMVLGLKWHTTCEFYSNNKKCVFGQRKLKYFRDRVKALKLKFYPN